MDKGDQVLLTIVLDLRHLPVSYLSSLLRVVQAAVREIGRTEEETRLQFERRPQPILLLDGLTIESDLTLQMTFADPLDSTPMPELSASTFNAFLDRFVQYVRGLPQPSLWGGAAPGSPRRPFDSEVMRRMDQVYRELRRSPKAAIRSQGRTVEVEGDRMVIG